MNSSYTIVTVAFGVGLLSGYLIRKNWFLFRGLLGAKKPSNSKTTTTTNKKNDGPVKKI